MYTDTNYKYKKQLKEDFLAGKEIRVHEPGPFPAKTDGWVAIEGPHSPEPHRWYASVRLEKGVIKEIKDL